MIKKWSVKILYLGLILILLLGLSSRTFSFGNNKKALLASAGEMNSEEVRVKKITSQEAMEVIRNAYLNSICIFNRDVDRSEYIDEGIYCRPQDKQLSYNTQ